MGSHVSLFPAGLSAKQAKLLQKLIATVDPRSPQTYLEEARQHLQDVRTEHKKNDEVNIRLATALFSTFEEIVEQWAQIPDNALAFLCAAMRYFASCEDEVRDYDSNLGFEDDTEVLNSCLELAGLSDFQLEPAHYDQ